MEKVKAVLLLRCWQLLGVTISFYLGSKLPINYFIFDLLDHLQPYYFLCFFIITCIGFFYLKNKCLGIFSTLVLIGSLIASLYPLRDFIDLNINKTRSNSSLKIIQVNIYYKNTQYQKIKNLIEQENPDLISIIEYSPQQQEHIGSFLSEKYPFQYTRSIDSPTGMGLFSKIPLKETLRHDPALDGFGLLSTTLTIGKKEFNLLAIHPFPSIHQDGLKRRQAVQKDLAKHLQLQNAETIVIGDFNNTLWSTDFLKLMKSLHVKVNLLTPTTWPSITVFPRIGIDHILIPLDAHFISIKQGPDIGSDHYPVIAEISL